MAKFYGKIGYFTTIETEPGVWEEKIVERNYYGDITRNTNRTTYSNNNVNDNIIISNSISVIADPFATNNFQHMKYVEYLGTKWKISNAEIQYPRILLTIGEVYNENS